jgi:hypothetical protein
VPASVTASPPPPLPLTLPAGPPRHGARCARQGGGGSVRSSTIVTILTVTRARRQVVGPTPKPRCRRQCGNAARAAALGLCSPPPSVKDGTGQGGRGSPAPDRTSARSGLRVGAADRPPPHSARRCLCRENDGYERVYSPTPARPSSRSRASAWRARAAIRAHQTRAPRQGEARAPRSGYARASSPHTQGPGSLPWVLLDCSSVLPRELGRRRGHLGPAAGALPSWQAVSTSLTRALGGGAL